jgi:hypothetical protein
MSSVFYTNELVISNTIANSIPFEPISNNNILYNPNILDKIIKFVKLNIKNKTVNYNSATDLILCCINIIKNYEILSEEQKKQYIILVIEEISKGDDGISNTIDDLIPENVIITLRKILEQNILSDLVNIISRIETDTNVINPINCSNVNPENIKKKIFCCNCFGF